MLVEGGGFEPPKLTRQIYSLIPLATREPLRKEPGILETKTLNVNKLLEDEMEKNSLNSLEKSPN